MKFVDKNTQNYQTFQKCEALVKGKQNIKGIQSLYLTVVFCDLHLLYYQFCFVIFLHLHLQFF